MSACRRLPFCRLLFDDIAVTADTLFSRSRTMRTLLVAAALPENAVSLARDREPIRPRRIFKPGRVSAFRSCQSFAVGAASAAITLSPGECGVKRIARGAAD